MTFLTSEMKQVDSFLIQEKIIRKLMRVITTMGDKVQYLPFH